VVDGTLMKRGFTARFETDFGAFSALRRKLRSASRNRPVFDPQATAITAQEGVLDVVDRCAGEVVALQAFRADHAEPTLADWALGWMIGSLSQALRTRRAAIHRTAGHTRSHTN
jgi:hypothetical protein